MSAAFTPGPWFAHPIHIRDNYKASKPIFDDGLWHVRMESDPETCPIAEIDRGDDRDEATRRRAEADARLIAASPELYAACAAVADAYNDAANYDMLTEQLETAVMVVRAALAKARGEQS